MVKMGAREFVYPNFGYRSRWLRNRDPVYCDIALRNRFPYNEQWLTLAALTSNWLLKVKTET